MYQSYFPSRDELQDIIYDYNFNKNLSIIRDRMNEATAKMKKQYFINEIFEKYDSKIINDVRLFLLNKDYVIEIVKDHEQNHIGWNIDWS